MMWLISRLTGEIEKIDPISARYIEEVNGERTLEITSLTVADKYDSVIFKDQVGKWQEFIVQGVEEFKDGVQLYLEHSSYELHNHIVRDKRPVNRSVEYILGELLDGTRWTVGTSDIGGFFSMSFYYKSVYEGLKTLLEHCSGELEFIITVADNKVTSRTINVKTALGSDKGRIFAYRKDLFGVKKTINHDIFTALIGRGRGEQISEEGYGRRITFAELDKPDSPYGVDYVEDVAAKEAFGLYSNGVAIHRMGTIEFDEIEDPEELYLETKKILAERSVPKFSYQIGVVLLNEPSDAVELGDVVYIYDNDYRGETLKLTGRILKISHDLLRPDNTEITISNVVDDMATFQKKVDYQLSLVRAKAGIWDKANAFNQNNQLPASYIQGMLDAWNEAANMSGGYTYSFDGQGTITYDKPHDQNPTMAVQIVGGTLRIANSKTVEGEWNWRTVINADGIAGEQILANSITVNKLASDVGANLDISSNEAITTKVSTTDLSNTLSNYSTITQTADKVALEIGNLQVGVSNLISNSSLTSEVSRDGWHIWGTATLSYVSGVTRVQYLSTSNFGLQTPTFSVQSGQTYTVSFDGASEFSTPSLNYNFLIVGGVGVQALPSVTVNAGDTNLRRYSFTFTSNTTSTSARILIGRSGGSSTTDGFKIGRVKIELGTKSTGWNLQVNEMRTARYIFDGEYATFKNGGLRIQNNAGTTVFDADTNGNLRLTGQINALSGNIGNYSLSNGILSTTGTYQTATFTSADMNRLSDILSGLITPTSADWTKFDVNKDGVLSISDLVIVNLCVGGSLPNPMTFRTNTLLGQTSGDLVSELRGNHNNVLYGGSKISPSSIRTRVGLFDNVYLIQGNTSYRLALGDEDSFGRRPVYAYSDYYAG